MVESLEAVEEAFRPLYTKNETDGKFYLTGVEGLVPKDKVNEFRTNNVTLQKEKKALEDKLAALGGIDQEKYNEMLKQIEEMDDKKLLDEGKMEELLEQRTERMKNKFESQINKQTEAIEGKTGTIVKLKAQLAKAMIDGRIATAINKVGQLREGALADALHRASGTWKMVEQDDTYIFQPQDESGTIRYGEDGKSVLTDIEWAKELFEQAPFLFEGSSGSGGEGDGGGSRKAGTIQGGTDLSAGDIDKIASGELTVTS